MGPCGRGEAITTTQLEGGTLLSTSNWGPNPPGKWRKGGAEKEGGRGPIRVALPGRQPIERFQALTYWEECHLTPDRKQGGRKEIGGGKRRGRCSRGDYAERLKED